MAKPRSIFIFAIYSFRGKINLPASPPWRRGHGGTLAYKLVHLLVRLIFKLIARVEVFGMQHAPDARSAIVVSNHIGRLDAGLIYYAVNRQDIIMLVAEKYRHHRFYRWVAESLNGIFVDRFNADLSAMREVLRRLDKGGVLAMAPEGTRSPTGALQVGKDGASYLAARSGVTVIPVAINGCQDAIVKQRLKRLQRLHITVNLGKPFTLPPLQGREREAQLKACTEEIMCQIAALLPPEMHGAYAGHPRIQELLAQ